jgi:hypothetical protein
VVKDSFVRAVWVTFGISLILKLKVIGSVVQNITRLLPPQALLSMKRSLGLRAAF